MQASVSWGDDFIIVTTATFQVSRIQSGIIGDCDGSSSVVILAGVHGDEPKSVDLVRRFLDWAATRASANRIVVVPVVNLQGYAVRRRVNGRGVDLNRNFPTRDWCGGRKRSRYYPGPSAGSERETRAVMRLIERERPTRIVTIHSIDKHRYCNNYDGPGKRLATMMSRRNGYPVRATIGYPTPGSLGTWAGVERGIATVTLELPSHHSPKRCWEDNRAALAVACGFSESTGLISKGLIK